MALVARKCGVPELTTQEITPVKSSSSSGTAERYARTLAAMVRTLRFSLEDRMGMTVDVMSPGFNMLVLHANFLYNRYKVRASGMTAFEDQMGRSYR
eukprot:2057757-Heterocapsa_arctica.AAC.1